MRERKTPHITNANSDLFCMNLGPSVRRSTFSLKEREPTLLSTPYEVEQRSEGNTNEVRN